MLDRHQFSKEDVVLSLKLQQPSYTISRFPIYVVKLKIFGTLDFYL